jgi:hypothetical protein
MRYQLALMFLAGTRAVHGAYNHLHLALATLNTESVPSEKFKASTHPLQTYLYHLTCVVASG